MELLVQLELGLVTNYLVTSTDCGKNFKKVWNHIVGIRGGYDNDEDGDVDIYYEGNNAGIEQLKSSVTWRSWERERDRKFN